MSKARSEGLAAIEKGAWAPATHRVIADLRRAMSGDGPVPRFDVQRVIDLERQRNPRSARTMILLAALEVGRDVLVFAPVAITWAHLRQALPLYTAHVAEQVAANDEARADGKAGTDVASFLVAWQDDLEGAAPLSTVALQVLLVISAVMVLSIALGLARSMVVERRAAAVDHLAQELVGAQLTLAAHPPSPGVEATTDDAASALHATLVASTTTVQQGATSIALAGDRLLTVVQALGSDVETLKQAAERLTDLATTKEEIDAARAFVREMRVLTTRSGRSVDRSEAAVEALGTQLSEALRRLGLRETKIADAMGVMTECIDVIERLLPLLRAFEASVVVDLRPASEPTDA